MEVILQNIYSFAINISALKLVFLPTMTFSMLQIYNYHEKTKIQTD